MYMKNKLNIIQKILLATLACLFISGCDFKEEEVKKIPKPVVNHYYNDRVSFFKEFGNQSYDVVFVGDSITDYANWDEIFTQYKVANRGIKSDTSSGVMKRLSSVKTSNAKVAFLMIGTNDVTNKIPVQTIVDNIENIVTELSPLMDLHIQSVLLTQREERNPTIIELNQDLQELAVDHGINYIDLNSLLAPNGSLSDEFTSDGIHINGDAYRLWAQHIQSYMP